MTYKAASQNDNKAYTHAQHSQTMLDGGWCQRAGLLFLFLFSGDESPYRLHLCLENTWNLMMLCSLMCMARLVTLQPVLSGSSVRACAVAVADGTRVVQTCAVTCHRPSTTHPSPPPTAPWKSAGGIC
jgi:hypothetical protein